LTTFTYTRCAHEQKAHGGAVDRGVAIKKQLLRGSWALPNDSKHNGANFLTISTDLLCLRVSRTPGDFCIDDRQTDRQTDVQTNQLLYPLLHMGVRGNNWASIVQIPLGIFMCVVIIMVFCLV
jgi:hypothetical protein